MTSKVTQCPKCQTSFRATEAQLNTANGVVRCGSCLHIFNAADHWLTEKPATAEIKPVAPQPSTPDTETEEPATNPEVASHQLTPDEDNLINDSHEQQALDDIFVNNEFDSLSDELQLNDTLTTIEPNAASNYEIDHDIIDAEALIDDELDEDNLINDSHEQQALDDIFVNNEFDSLSDDLATQKTNGDDELQLNDSESTIEPSGAINYEIDHDVIDAEALIDDELDEDDSTDISFSNAFLDLDKLDEISSTYKDLDDLGDLNDDDDDNDSNEEEWAEKLLKDDAKTTEHEQASDSLTEPQEDPTALDFDQIDSELLDIIPEHEQSPLLNTAEEDVFILDGEPLIAGEQIGKDKQALLANIEPAPVEISSPKNYNLWAQRAWKLGIVAALLLLAGQYIAFNFDQLSRNESYRPLLATACKTLNCQLPRLDDVSLIRSSNLIVRSHPSTRQALAVDVIITNRATFKQRYPVIELQFTDLAGNTVAGRQFKPSEYLEGELLGSQMMPSKQPVHISWEIVHPGEQAVNYQINFHANGED